MRWHIQTFGQQKSEALLLLHGTGSASHSWRALAPLLAKDQYVIALDLPGHGFTEKPPDATGYALPGMSLLLHKLIQTLSVDITLVAGHSAGAAIAVWMCLDGLIKPRKVVGINAALVPLTGIAGHVFSPLAKIFWITGAMPSIFAWSAQNPLITDRLINGTGSSIDAEGRALYARLLRSPPHVEAALAMMANWDLERLARRLSELDVPLLQIVGQRDKTVPPSDAQRVAQLLPAARTVYLEGLGHLAHEEQPALVAEAIKDGKRYF
jgi:magnesium chelatase accessory protein